MEGVDFLEGDAAGAAGKRMHIYRAMLQHMTDEQRIQVTAKLTQDVLGAATDEDGSEAGSIQIQSYNRASRFAQGQRREALLRKLRRDESLVRDALAVLRCPDIKVAGGRGGSGGAGAGVDEDADALMMEDGQGGSGGGGATGAEAAAAAKGRLLSKVSRKHLLEHVVPELVSLKACLERAHSPLLKDVMEYLMDLMRAHKEEVKDALSASPTLFHEIEYDLQQFEREREKKAQEEAAAAAAAAEARTTAPTEETDAPAAAPASPTASNAGRRSSVASAASSSSGGAGQRRRSSVGSAAGAAAPDSAGGAGAAGTGPQKKTPRTSCSTAPRLRRSSAGAGLSRTPAEAIRAAMQPEEGGPVVSQALTPVPLKRRDEDDDDAEEVEAPAAEPDENEAPTGTRRTRGGGKKAAAAGSSKAAALSRGTRRTRRGAAAAKEEEGQDEEGVAMEEAEAEAEEDGMRVDVTLPKAKGKWKVTAGRSPLDSAASKANTLEVDEEI